MQSTFYKTWYLFFLLVALLGCKKESETQPTPTPPVTMVTIENYNLITAGMTYTQVVTLLGPGTNRGSNEYSWSADNTNTIIIYVVFANNTVQTKRQTGLASGSSGGTTGGTTGGSTTGGSCPATYNGRMVYTGPRGGCYYINSNGNKTYI
ncbi:hypothetical protein [Hymenobacter sp. HDW8]|uniref:hypothetical protein n=1 Tax=Hymenobacter sp. HDW8 TaxID=2714932 RepID=UPI001F113C9A|nr:hypothetical protein [Hymenobacter sp. HDW8]